MQSLSKLIHKSDSACAGSDLDDISVPDESSSSIVHCCLDVVQCCGVECLTLGSDCDESPRVTSGLTEDEELYPPPEGVNNTDTDALLSGNPVLEGSKAGSIITEVGDFCSCGCIVVQHFPWVWI